MSEHRIYGEKHEIDTENTRAFYNERAKRLAQMDNPYVSVLLGDQDPTHAKQWNDYEKENILPQLKLDKGSAVLDIGCGIGRWAESALPLAGYYFGADFSEEMIKVVTDKFSKEENCTFFNASFNEIAEKNEGFFERKFNRVIISGVCMYINDDDLEKCLNGFIKHLDKHCIMYLTETVAVETRLTLDNCPSEALKTNYDVIYRTPDKYNEYYKIFQNAGFEIIKQGFLPHLNNEKQFSETDRWYSIFER